MLTLLALVGAAHALDLQQAHADAALEFGVPEKLLLALSYEASHWRPEVSSQWGGYGLFDLREPDEACTDSGGCGPDLELAAALLDESPDALITDPAENIRGGAALLAYHARRAHGGTVPGTSALLDWWDAVRAFGGRPSPQLQEQYAAYVYEVVNLGVLDEPGIELRPEPVDHWSMLSARPPTSSCDYGGCYQFVPASTSNYSNYSRSGSDIDYVVVHTVQGSYSGCISWFQNGSASVSAHYVVRSSDGQVTQMVREEDVAWHAGNWDYNLASVGIEHEGYVDQPETYYTDAMYAGSAALVSDIVGRTHVSADRSHIIGHVEVPGATHTDPGSGWDWDTYMSLIDGGEVTGDLVGVVADSDIYNGERLVGATVWVDETGETTSSDADGYYRFFDLPLDSYTIYASADGYEIGTCSKNIAAGDNWCSIALTPSSGGDGGADDDGGAGDGGALDGGAEVTVPSRDRPGKVVRPADPRGCATAAGSPSALVALLALGLTGLRRRLRRDN